MIPWRNKLYTFAIFISYTTCDISVAMIDQSFASDEQNTSNDRYPIIRDGHLIWWSIGLISYCLNQSKAEIYIIITAIMEPANPDYWRLTLVDNDDNEYEAAHKSFFIIYDLNKREKKFKYELNFDDASFKPNDIKKISHKIKIMQFHII